MRCLCIIFVDLRMNAKHNNNNNNNIYLTAIGFSPGGSGRNTLA